MSRATPKSDRERASRLRKRQRELEDEGETLPDRDARWLARYADAHPPRAARPRESSPPSAPREPAQREAVSDAEFFELPPLSASSPATPAATQATPGAPVSSGQTPVAGAPATPTNPQGGPLPTLHKTACVIKDCPGCAGQLATGPQVCATTGLPVYPELSDVAARGFASALLFLVGLGVSMYARIALHKRLQSVAPTDLERSELADALRAAFRTRPSVGWIGQSFGDIAAAAASVGSYARRSMAAPLALPAEASNASD